MQEGATFFKQGRAATAGLALACEASDGVDKQLLYTLYSVHSYSIQSNRVSFLSKPSLTCWKEFNRAAAFKTSPFAQVSQRQGKTNIHPGNEIDKEPRWFNNKRLLSVP